jgi:hypothetical protein
MRPSPKVRKLVAQLLTCSLPLAGLLSLAAGAGRASHKHFNASSAKTSAPQAKTVDEATRARVRAAYEGLPLSFEENRGQADAEVKYVARGPGYALFLTQTEAVLSLRSAGGEAPSKRERPRPRRASQPAVLRMRLRGANPAPAVTGEGETGVRTNYFRGDDPQNWHTDVARFGRVRYAQVYPGIDVVYYGEEQRQLEYDFEVAPGADTRQIRLEFAGVRRVRVERRTGELVLKTPHGEVRQHQPVAYQEAGGARREVASRYVLRGEREVGLEVGEYDRTKPLVIDPVLTYSTYLGTTDDEFATDIAADASGYAYVLGRTNSTRFPVKNGSGLGQNNSEYYDDVFVAKLDTNVGGRASLLYSTYLGDDAWGSAIAVDALGVVYVTGVARTNFPTKNEYQTCEKGGVFVTKLDTNASGAAALLYSTCLGGSSWEGPRGIAVDASGYVYVAGYTNSPDFPSVRPYQTNQANVDAFVSKLDTKAAGPASLLYSTYLGGTSFEMATGVAADAAGHAYVTGETRSTNFPLKNQLQKNQADVDAFVTKLDTNVAGPASLLYSTYLGGNSEDHARDIAADNEGNAYVTGETWSTDFPTKNQYQGDAEHIDAFVTKLDTNAAGAASLRYSTYLGGVWVDVGVGIGLDPSGNVYVVGDTSSGDFPTKNPYQMMRDDSSDIFITKLNPNLAGEASLLYSTYLGGDFYDVSAAIAVDPVGNAYVTGYTHSSAFPLRKAFQGRQYGWRPWGYITTADIFVSKFTATHRISGRVTSDGKTGVGGVTMTLGGSKSATYVTTSDGTYSFGGLPAGGDYTITAYRSGLTLAPPELRFDHLVTDYTGVDIATISDASIGGRVTKYTGEGLAGRTSRRARRRRRATARTRSPACRRPASTG